MKTTTTLDDVAAGDAWLPTLEATGEADAEALALATTDLAA